MCSFSGKKLLILGANRAEIEIINKAKEMGLYTIVTDNHTDYSLAPAKLVANEAWDISWAAIEVLAQKCVDTKVDGIFAGFSEKRVSCANLLSQKIRKPFYANNALLEVICDKDQFKDMCIKNDIKVARSFEKDGDVVFPVIVKPSDNGGSRGITICYTKPELENALQKAVQFSDSGNVVVEEYIVADEVMVYFTVHNGNITLSAMCDRYMHRFDRNITQLPIGYYYPSKYLNIFQKYNLNKFRDLIADLRVSNGLIAFQAFVVGNDIIPFDPTFRLDGTMAYNMIEKVNNINVLELLIKFSLNGNMGSDKDIFDRENPNFRNPCFEMPILLTNGTITKITGLNDVLNIEGVCHLYQCHTNGSVMKNIADFSQIFCRIHICVENIMQLKDVIKRIYKVLDVYDEHGRSMVISAEVAYELIEEI